MTTRHHDHIALLTRKFLLFLLPLPSLGATRIPRKSPRRMFHHALPKLLCYELVDEDQIWAVGRSASKSEAGFYQRISSALEIGGAVNYSNYSRVGRRYDATRVWRNF